MFKKLFRLFRPLIAVVIIGLGSIAFVLLTGGSLCIIYNTTGIPCPSCGMSRAFKNLFTFNISGAFSCHPLFGLIILLPVIAFLNYKFPNKKRENIVYIIMTVAFVLTWVVRMIILFPSDPPMTFNPDALLPRLFSSIV